MSLRDDRRAQSIQIGAVLLFGVLIILLATYQAFVVPNQNREVEGNHVATITQQMQEVRNAIVSLPGAGGGQSITLTLGVEYPSRVIALNPPSPTGTVRTLGTTEGSVNTTVANAVATDGEVDDYWTGTNRSVNSGGIAYRPGYHEYQNPPTIVYENSLLYHEFRSGILTRAGQRFVDGRELTLLTLNGSIDRAASDSVALDLQDVSASSRRISITNETGENVTVDIASRLTASRWESRFVASGEMANQTGGYVVDVTDTALPNSEFQVVHVELAGDEVYTLQMAKVGVGTGVESEGVQYLTDIQGDGASITEGSPTQLVLEARDAFNNPVSGVRVYGSVGSGGGSLDEQSVVTDEDGRASFEYDAEDDVSGTQQAQVEFSYNGTPGAGFDAGAAENVSMSVSVQDTDAGGGGGGGGGAYSVSWSNPASESANSGDGFDGCDSESCTWDVGDSADNELQLNATLSPVFQGVDLEFAVNDTTVGTLSPTSSVTGTDGAAATTLTADANGTVAVLASGNEGSDVIDINVVGLSDTVLEYVTGTGSAARAWGEDRVDFDIRNTGGSQVTVTGFRIESSSNSLDSVYETNTGQAAPGQHELYIDSSDPGEYEGGGGNAYQLGTDATLTDSATLNPGEQAQVTIYAFRNPGGQTVSAADKQLTITLYLQNGDSTTFTFTPPGY